MYVGVSFPLLIALSDPQYYQMGLFLCSQKVYLKFDTCILSTVSQWNFKLTVLGRQCLVSLQQLTWHCCNQVLNSPCCFILFHGNYTPDTIVGTPTAFSATLNVVLKDGRQTLAGNRIEALAVNGRETLAVDDRNIDSKWRGKIGSLC